MKANAHLDAVFVNIPGDRHYLLLHHASLARARPSCMHIKTFRGAEKYGPAIEPFKRGLKEAVARRPSG